MTKTYYEAHKEEIKAKARQWYQDNRERAAANARKWRAENPDKVTDGIAKWRAENPEKSKVYARRWQEAHRDELREYARVYARKFRAEHKDEINAKRAAAYVSKRVVPILSDDERKKRRRASMRSWEKHNPDRVAAIRSTHYKTRRARIANAPVNDLTTVQWRERVAEFDGLCAYCLKPMDVVTCDHMTPLVRGGSHTLSNVIPCCMECNVKKGTRTLLEFVGAT